MFKVCGLIVLISVYFIANLALANEEAPVVIYTEDFPPHQYMENGKLIGPALNKVRRIFDLANISYEIKVLPWPRAFNLAKKIPNSFIFSMNRTTEREAFFNWLYPVSTIENHFITLADNPITLSQLDDAKKLIVCVIRQGSSFEYLKQMGFSEVTNLYVVPSYDDQLSLLFHKKVDLLFTDLTTVRFKLQQTNQDSHLVKSVLSVPQSYQQLYLASNINTEINLLNKLYDALQQLSTLNSAYTND